MPRPLILICIVVFAAVMLVVRFAAHAIIDNFGVTAMLAVIAAMMCGAHWLDQRERP